MTDHIADVSKMVADNPGVQGLAQLGRNAIDRVAELERELAAAVAERESLVKSLATAYTRLAFACADLEKAEARLAAIDAAPTVAVVLHDAGREHIEMCTGDDLPHGTELIARQAKEAT